MNSLKRGFTLIELLVVIAIIGILASVILASLNSARSKGADAAVKSNLSTVRTQAEFYYDVYSRYRRITGSDYSSSSCASTSTVFGDSYSTSTEALASSKIVQDAVIAAYEAGGSSGLLCRSSGNGDEYMVAVKMSSGPYWCVDSAGSAKSIGTSVPAAGINYCP